MFARLLLFSATILPLCAQDSDVTRYLDDLRAKHASVPGDSGETQHVLANLTARLASASDLPQRAELYRQISLTERSLHHNNAAVEALRSARAIAPDDERIAADLAYLLVERGDDAEAATILGENPQDGAALIRRAGELTHEQRKVLAAMCLSIAQRALPDTAAGDDALGAAYLVAGRIDEAIRVLDRGAAKEGGNLSIHLHLATAFTQKGYRDYALGELNAALACNPAGDVRAVIEELRARLEPH